MALPSGYTQLNYIENTGQASIDTKFTPTANTRVVMDFQLTAAGTSNACLFGVAGQFSFRWYGLSSVFRSNGNNSVNFPTGINGTARHWVDKSATSCTLDGEYSVTNTAASTISYPLHLLAQCSGTGTSNHAKAKLYSCQIYESGTLVRDFVPCTNSSGAVGMYDTVNGVFYDRSNTSLAGFVSGGVYDPTAPVGDHNTLIDGTAHEIEDGSVMVNGTVYEIEISLPVTTVKITGSGNGTYAYVTIDGTKYTTATTIEVNQGTTITAYVKTTASNMVDGEVIMNGSMVADSASNTLANYSFVANTDSVNINLEYLTYKTYYGGRITITTS